LIFAHSLLSRVSASYFKNIVIRYFYLRAFLPDIID
jgi:hypothetical protein